jgi:predicted aldo/keto reductase-like oxidoreductase
MACTPRDMGKKSVRSNFGRRAFVAGAVASVAQTACTRADVVAPPPDPLETRTTEIPMRPFGRTGVSVSIVGVGGYHIGVPKNEADGIRIIRTALDRGITFLDNCWDYHRGMSEERMGKALRDGYRKKAFLMTKIDGRTREAASAQLDQSLERLQTDVIDLVQIHEVIRPTDPDRCFAPDGAMEALVAAKQAGKVRFLGFTGHKHPDIHTAMLDAAERHGFVFDAVQMPLNVMDAHFRSFEKAVLPRLVANRIAVLGMKSMGAGGILGSGVVTPVECLHYAMNLPTSVVITGCDSIRVLDQAIAAALSFRPLSDKQVRDVLDKTRELALTGDYERFKTSDQFDGTGHNPKWLEKAEI